MRNSQHSVGTAIGWDFKRNIC